MYVYGDIITRGMHSNNSFIQTKIILAVFQTRTAGKQWHITYMQSHVTDMQYIFKLSFQTPLSQRFFDQNVINKGRFWLVGLCHTHSHFFYYMTI